MVAPRVPRAGLHRLRAVGEPKQIHGAPAHWDRRDGRVDPARDRFWAVEALDPEAVHVPSGGEVDLVDEHGQIPREGARIDPAVRLSHRRKVPSGLVIPEHPKLLPRLHLALLPPAAAPREPPARRLRAARAVKHSHSGLPADVRGHATHTLGIEAPHLGVLVDGAAVCADLGEWPVGHQRAASHAAQVAAGLEIGSEARFAQVRVRVVVHPGAWPFAGNREALGLGVEKAHRREGRGRSTDGLLVCWVASLVAEKAVSQVLVALPHAGARFLL
mmetsp:Transcript_26168/g.83606  ORF Transcript_26168/g.83606 Transcript_26168/m.83606 type:complete len:274 (-) Transcript_26168:873-1694(-)